MAKILSSQCWGPGFNPWSENWIPHAATKSLYAATKCLHAVTKTQCSQTLMRVGVLSHFSCV